MKTFARYISSCHVTDTPRGRCFANIKTLVGASKFKNVKTWSDVYHAMDGNPFGGEGRRAYRERQKTSTAEDILS